MMQNYDRVTLAVAAVDSVVVDVTCADPEGLVKEVRTPNP